VPLSANYWTTVYDGYGSITYDVRTGIVMSPEASTAPSETHAALTLANIAQLKNFRISITAATDESASAKFCAEPMGNLLDII